MKNYLTTALILFCAIIANAQVQSKTTATPSDDRAAPDSGKASMAIITDEQFVMKAAEGGMKEVHMGKEGSSKAASPRVKNYAMMMVRDHTKANKELKAIAEKNKLTIPGENKEMEMDNMLDKTGPDYDKEYMEMMVMDHNAAIELFEMESQNGKNADVKAFAIKTLPILKMHLDSAKAVQASLIK